MRVLVALDESPASLHAGRTAAKIFAVPEAEFLVVNATRFQVPWIAQGPYGQAWIADPRIWTEIDDASKDDQRLAVAAEAAQAGLEGADLVVEPGDPADVIALAAEQHDVDVIVVGSHNKGLLKRLWDPSVSDQVVHRTRRPVLIVSDPDEA